MSEEKPVIDNTEVRIPRPLVLDMYATYAKGWLKERGLEGFRIDLNHTAPQLIDPDGVQVPCAHQHLFVPLWKIYDAKKAKP